jgi:hypothetical protein
MALGYSVALRNAQLNQITSTVGSAGLLRIYFGTKPAIGGSDAGSTLLAQLTMGSPFAAAAASGVLTLGTITNASAIATNTAQWFRIQTSGGTQCIDGTVSTQAAGTGDLQLNDTAIVNGGTVAISAATITAGNAT